MSKINMLTLKMDSDSPMEFVEGVLRIYETQKKMSGGIESVLRDSLIKALSIYMIDGVNKESKKKVFKFLNLKDYSRVNIINHELRKEKYLVKKWSDGIKRNFLNDELQEIANRVNKVLNGRDELKNMDVKDIEINFLIKLPWEKEN